MVSYLSSRLAVLKNLPYTLKGDEHEKKLRLTFIIAGTACLFCGVYFGILNYQLNKFWVASIYALDVFLGIYIILTAFFQSVKKHLSIVMHLLLLTIILSLLLDHHEGTSRYSACNHLIALCMGAALVLRQQSSYQSKGFPLLCFAVYLGFSATGITFFNGEFHFDFSQDSSFYLINCLIPMAALLLTVFSYRGDYSETDLIKRDLANAIERDQLELYYQPQVDANRMVTGFEALLRWKHPTKGFISPEVFIPVAEKSGLIIDIGNWVLDSTLKQLSRWDELRDIKHLVFSVNISPLQLIHRDFTSMTKYTLSSYDIDPSRIKFEITESAFIYDEEGAAKVINHFNQIGVRWAIDDFGVGYSSLKSLSDFLIDDIKIDKSLIMQIFENESAAIVVQKTIELSREMGLKALAEGVESEDYFKRLKSMGCHLYQGYLFAKPLSAADTLTYIHKNCP